MKYTCSVCGEEHEERPALAFLSPYHYDTLSEEDKASIAILNEDVCVIKYQDQTDQFIRATMSLPIIGSDDRFEYGVWVSLSEKNLLHYIEHFKEDIEGTTFFGFLSNQIPGYEQTLNIKTNVVCGPKAQRPLVFPHDGQTDNPFVRDFLEGISGEEADRRIHSFLDKP